jgi:S-adenosylmethionine decarboxylase
MTTKFEGPEKKLEIILFAPQADLRSNCDGRWNRVVEASRAAIISGISTDDLDAYLLSESSLFVWEDRILMITCGKTTLIQAVPELFKIINKDRIAFVFYERKSFMFPHEQPSNFEDEVACLVQYFPGKSYRLGPANYDHIHVFYSSQTNNALARDATFQLLMHELDPAVLEIFALNNGSTGDKIEKISGLNRIYPQMLKHSHLFSPYGYSLNGIFKKNYFTIHVTPQPEGSYASFETNVIEKDYFGLTNEVISIFKPEKFSLVLTTSIDDRFRITHSTVADALPAYTRAEKSLYEFDCGYAITFLNYIRL